MQKEAYHKNLKPKVLLSICQGVASIDAYGNNGNGVSEEHIYDHDIDKAAEVILDRIKHYGSIKQNKKAIATFLADQRKTFEVGHPAAPRSLLGGKRGISFSYFPIKLLRDKFVKTGNCTDRALMQTLVSLEADGILDRMVVYGKDKKKVKYTVWGIKRNPKSFEKMVFLFMKEGLLDQFTKTLYFFQEGALRVLIELDNSFDEKELKKSKIYKQMAKKRGPLNYRTIASLLTSPTFLEVLFADTSIEEGFKIIDQLNNSIAYRQTNLSHLDLIFFSCQIVDIMKGQLNFQEPMDKNLYQIIIKNNSGGVGTGKK